MSEKIFGIWGDSIAYGAYDRKKGGWASRLQQHLDGGFVLSEQYQGGPRLYNLSIWGNRIENVLQTFESELVNRRVTLALLAVGINDSPHKSHPLGTSIDLFEKQFSEVINIAKKHNIDLIIVGPTNVDDTHPKNQGYSNQTIKQYAAVIKKLSKQYKLRFIDLFGVLSSYDVDVDGVHPNAAGHKKIFDKVVEVIW